MPPTNTVLRTLLLSTADVLGTEGRKRKLRLDGHANNLLWGPPSFFATANFADTYSPLVKMLHDGPGRDSHLNICGASQPAADSLRGNLASTQPRMPSLRRMHEIVAQDPRAHVLGRGYSRFSRTFSNIYCRSLISSSSFS